MPTSAGGGAGGAMGSTAAGGASVYSKLLGTWWRGATGALKGGANGVLCAALHPCKQCTMHAPRYGTRTEN